MIYYKRYTYIAKYITSQPRVIDSFSPGSNRIYYDNRHFYISQIAKTGQVRNCWGSMDKLGIPNFCLQTYWEF